MKLRAPLPTGIALLLALAPTQSNANTPPTITLPTEATTAEDVYPLAVPISWMDPDGLETYQWSFESSDSTLVAPARIRVTAGSKGRLLVLEPTAGTSG